ncbi:hypothetical protein DFS34DRAFT_654372 [Phlyctochytrium arcticum]|nr:hypothetical protein DFS34DRAFT_654372 [Phlyctochytrium arcticum]
MTTLECGTSLSRLNMPADHQTTMFSATFPIEVQTLAVDTFRNHVSLTVDSNPNRWNVVRSVVTDVFEFDREALPQEPPDYPINVYIDELRCTRNINEESIG